MTATGYYAGGEKRHRWLARHHPVHPRCTRNTARGTTQFRHGSGVLNSREHMVGLRRLTSKWLPSTTTANPASRSTAATHKISSGIASHPLLRVRSRKPRFVAGPGVRAGDTASCGRSAPRRPVRQSARRGVQPSRRRTVACRAQPCGDKVLAAVCRPAASHPLLPRTGWLRGSV